MIRSEDRCSKRQNGWGSPVVTTRMRTLRDTVKVSEERQIGLPNNHNWLLF